MVNATAFPVPYGWSNIVNESMFNLFIASKDVWESSAHGYGWMIAGTFIILLVPIAIWSRSQNTIAAAFGQLLMTVMLHKYKLVPLPIWTSSYIMIILMISFSVVLYFYKKKGE